MTRTESIASLYATMTGKKESDITKGDLDKWLNLDSSIALETINASMLSMDGALVYPTGTEAYIKATFKAVFGYIPDENADGFAYWVNELDSGSVSADTLAIALLNGAAAEDEQRAIDKVDAAVGNLSATQTMYLTTGQDVLTGGDGNDTFTADIINNTDSAQSGDRLDGGAGEDTLYADMGTSSAFAPTIRTTSVENFLVRAQSDGAQTDGDNNIDDNNAAGLFTEVAVVVDAERMDGTNHYESNNSRADVIIEDVRIQDDQVTKDITIAMVQTDPGDVDFAVYFDQHSLRNAAQETSGAGIDLKVMDITNAIATGDMLSKNPYNKVLFKLDGVDFELVLDEALIRGTYAQLVEAINNAIDETAGLETVTAAVNGTFTGIESGTGIVTPEGSIITLTTSDARIFETAGWIAEGLLPADNEFVASQSLSDPSASTFLITSTVILDDVGRGSMGGDLVIGGLSTGLTSDSTGVEQFDITVERSSELGVITSTANTLEEVYIVNGETKGDLVVEGDGANAVNANQSDLAGINGAAGFTDVRVIDASAMEGSVSIDAVLTNAVVTKYMNSTDIANNEAADNVVFNYDLGTNDDILNLAISNANLLAAGTTTREDFVLDINGNNGDDTITTVIETGVVAPTSAWYQNSTINANLTVDGGAGNDTITTTGAGNFNILGGAGNDTVYANNDGNTLAFGQNEVQLLTFAAAGDMPTNGQITITLADGSTTTTAGANLITSGDTAIQVATKVALQTGAVLGTTAVVDNGNGTLTLTYAAAAGDVANAVVTANLATDTAANANVVTTAGIAATVAAAAVTSVQTVDFGLAGANNVAVGSTFNLNNEGNIAFVDTDGNGTVSIYEQAEQFAAAVTASANYTLGAVNYSLGQVQVASVASTTDLTVGAAAVDVLAVSAAGAAIVAGATDVAGAAAVAAAAGTQQVDTFTVYGADRAGTITISTAAYGDTDINISVGNAADVANEIVAALNANANYNAVIGASTDEIVLTFATATAPEAAVVLLDGAVIGNTIIAETAKGVVAGTGDAATWLVNADTSVAANIDIDTVVSNAAIADTMIYGSTLTVTYSGGQFSNSGVTNDAAVANSNGFESTVNITTSNNLGGQAQVNQAIKDAINNDAVLSKLLSATDGPANTLIITSLVDGQVVSTDLAIDIAGPTTLTTAELTSLNASYKDAINDSTAANLTGAGMIAYLGTNATTLDVANSTMVLAQDGLVDVAGGTSGSVSDNTITLGSGDDVAVLGTDTNSNDTLVFAGSFGNDTIFNFVDDASTAGDNLDFTAYFNGSISLSGSTASQTALATSGFNGNSTIVANSVVTLNNFAETSPTVDTWADLSASDLLAAIQNDALATTDYASLTDGTLDTVATANLFGTNKAVVMIENDLNDGEYKVFELTASETTTEFTAATLVGTIDFGDTIDASVAGTLI